MEYIKKIGRLSEIHSQLSEQKISFGCRVKSNQYIGKVGFLKVVDGSLLAPIQIVYRENEIKNFDEVKKYPIYSVLLVVGKVIKEEGKNIEVKAFSISLQSFSDDHPLQKKEHTLKFLRSIPHLRLHSFLFQWISRANDFVSNLTHTFFKKKGFYHVFPPLLTANQSETGGEAFRIKDSENLLTVSSQFYLECAAQALGKVYTISPVFRAEKSHTTRHLSESRMIEIESIYYSAEQMMDLIEDFLKYVIRSFLKENFKELEVILNKKVFPFSRQKLLEVLNSKFERLTYSDALDLLGDRSLWGKDLSIKHELFLCEKKRAGIFVVNHPAEIKPFYMKRDDNNGKNVKSFDLLLPNIGEVAGGGEREDSIDMIEKNSVISYRQHDVKNVRWYLDLRKYGYAQSSGCGIGFERLIMFMTGMKNIQDISLFPRTDKKIEV